MKEVNILFKLAFGKLFILTLKKKPNILCHKYKQLCGTNLIYYFFIAICEDMRFIMKYFTFTYQIYPFYFLSAKFVFIKIKLKF